MDVWSLSTLVPVTLFKALSLQRESLRTKEPAAAVYKAASFRQGSQFCAIRQSRVGWMWHAGDDVFASLPEDGCLKLSLKDDIICVKAATDSCNNI